jgi:ribosomal protein L12E/L44/L45/RPP1/RPP2
MPTSGLDSWFLGPDWVVIFGSSLEGRTMKKLAMLLAVVFAFGAFGLAGCAKKEEGKKEEPKQEEKKEEKKEEAK